MSPSLHMRFPFRLNLQKTLEHKRRCTRTGLMVSVVPTSLHDTCMLHGRPIIRNCRLSTMTSRHKSNARTQTHSPKIAPMHQLLCFPQKKVNSLEFKPLCLISANELMNVLQECQTLRLKQMTFSRKSPIFIPHYDAKCHKMSTETIQEP